MTETELISLKDNRIFKLEYDSSITPEQRRSTLEQIGISNEDINSAKIESLQTEILLNPGFELGTTSPSNWTLASTGTTAVYTYPETGRTGSPNKSISINIPSPGEAGTWSQIRQTNQSVTIDVTKTYKLSGWIKTESVSPISTGGVSIKVDWKDASLVYKGESGIMSYLIGTTSPAWQYFEGIVTPVTGTVYATIIAWINNSYGKVFFDDLSFTEVTTTTTSTSVGTTSTSVGTTSTLVGTTSTSVGTTSTSVGTTSTSVGTTSPTVTPPSESKDNTAAYILLAGGLLALLLLYKAKPKQQPQVEQPSYQYPEYAQT